MELNFKKLLNPNLKIFLILFENYNFKKRLNLFDKL
jgi:hypothetical protein